MCPFINNYYKYITIYIYNYYSGLKYILTSFIIILIIFVISILLDQPRKFLWKSLTSLENKNTTNLKFFSFNNNHNSNK